MWTVEQRQVQLDAREAAGCGRVYTGKAAGAQPPLVRLFRPPLCRLSPQARAHPCQAMPAPSIPGPLSGPCRGGQDGHPRPANRKRLTVRQDQPSRHGSGGARRRDGPAGQPLSRPRPWTPAG